MLTCNDILNNILSTALAVGTLSECGSVGISPTLSETRLGAVEMVQEGEGLGDALIAPRRLPNPCLENPLRMDLHRELMFNQKM